MEEATAIAAMSKHGSQIHTVRVINRAVKLINK